MIFLRQCWFSQDFKKAGGQKPWIRNLHDVLAAGLQFTIYSIWSRRKNSLQYRQKTKVHQFGEKSLSWHIHWIRLDRGVEDGRVIFW